MVTVGVQSKSRVRYCPVFSPLFGFSLTIRGGVIAPDTPCGMCVGTIGPGAMGPNTRDGNFRNRAVDGLRCFVTAMESWLTPIT